MKNLSELIKDAKQRAILDLLNEGYKEYGYETRFAETEELDNDQLKEFGLQVSYVDDDTSDTRYWAKYSKIVSDTAGNTVSVQIKPNFLRSDHVLVCTWEELATLQKFGIV